MTITVNLELGKREIENFQELEETYGDGGW